MMKLRLLLGLCVLLVGIGGSAALAAKPGAAGRTTCSGGSIAAGTYKSLTVTGTCTFAGGTVTINGNLKVADGAILNDHAASSATVNVRGNVIVGRGAVLGLGNYDPTPPHESATVGGNIVANQPLTLYLGGITVHGNVVSHGGGDPGRNFPIKDDTVDGNLIIQGWSGLWLGVIRATVGGNLIVSKNVAADTSQLPGSDSTEVQTNHVAGNLICRRNTPAAQVNPDDGGQPNVVGGRKLGQCRGL
jgi:hypothetical protein